MQGRDDQVAVVVLDVREQRLDVALLVVEDQRDGAGDLAESVSPWYADKSRTISASARERLAKHWPAFISVQLLGESGCHRDAEAAEEVFHRVTFLKKVAQWQQGVKGCAQCRGDRAFLFDPIFGPPGGRAYNLQGAMFSDSAVGAALGNDR